MCGTQVSIGVVEGDFNTAESPESKVDSIINIIISDIVTASIKMDLKNRNFPSTVLKKIEHNHLKNKRNIVQQYKSYSSNIERAYAVVDKQIINGKQTAMILLNDMYNKALTKFEIDPYDVDIVEIRKHADCIVDSVVSQLKKFVYKSSNLPSYKEQIELGVNIVVAHAFVECLILESPNVTN